MPKTNEYRILLSFRIALAVCVIAIAYLAFVPLSQAFGTPFDKPNHIIAFAVLAWLADMAYPGRRLAPYRWALLLGYGLTIEAIQGLLPYRESSLLDLAADAAGILCYSAVARVLGTREPAQSNEHRH